MRGGLEGACQVHQQSYPVAFVAGMQRCHWVGLFMDSLKGEPDYKRLPFFFCAFANNAAMPPPLVSLAGGAL